MLCQIQMSQSKFLTSKVRQSMLNGALMIEMVNNSFSESKKIFSRLRRRGKF